MINLSSSERGAIEDLDVEALRSAIDEARHHFRRSLRAISWHNGSLNESLQDLGRVAQSQAR